MYFDIHGGGQGKRALAILGGLLVLFFLLRGGSTPFVSGWRGDAAPPVAAAGLSGTAAQVGQIGQGATLVAPPDVAADEPWGNPVIGAHVVLTQGYGVGSHAPANVWGAVDLAVDGNGDGEADPSASLGAPVRATMSGIVQLTPNSWPAGNHIWVIGQGYKTGYSHLESFAVPDGQFVERGTVIGYLGSTGQSSGPHLDYQVWAAGVNQNPLDFHVLP